MNQRVVVAPCLPVTRAHLSEAQRSLYGQGYAREQLGEDELSQFLWMARALPAIIDVVSDFGVLDVRLTMAAFEQRAPLPSAQLPLNLVAWRKGDEPWVEVLVLASLDLDRRAMDEAFVWMGVDITPVEPAPIDDAGDRPAGGIVLQRFRA
jgi:hypothetical protein